ncbi:coniferyl aldehyde dehydrogenase [Pseudomonas laurylsulfatiphila]|uniref:coniferyl aldehyde dehydrogenase n=1 Tax=Pseudomonas laurylsulfatiphila TaxID=2011015 RepID=UPI00215F6749|nr:coniferyl aldehyde dehydrogenase [Pseudomonas laurylsulfatiphila]UVM03304.1 coniferyl aldehyde dehydrogenase [Pseudomonas laurylsulfatiphila]
MSALNIAQPIAPPAMQSCFEHQRAAYLATPERSHAQRVEDLKKLAQMLKDNRQALIEAINRDYGNRSTFETLFAEFFVVLGDIQSTIKHLKKWMKPQKRHIDLMVYPTSSNRVIPQPLGVVGVIVPWNFPLLLSFGPLTAIFAAGNRAMVKMSENSNNLTHLLMSITPKYFPPQQLQFFEDGGANGSVGPAFSSISFDHLFFTGSGQTGRAVMANAARNLTPVTLELGGKSPAVVAPDFPMTLAVDRIMWSKAFNAGQICTNVDYVFIPAGSEADFEREAQRVIAERYPDINHADYTSMIDQRAYDRMQATLDDAVAKGARVVNLFPGQAPDKSLRKFPLTLVFDVSDDMVIMQREIFGPLLPVKTYTTREEVAGYVNQHDRPLALYPFTRDRALQDYYVTHIMSGGVCINTALLHVSQHDMPFGGVGASGMGHYHGYEGFQTFSKMRPVYRQGFFAATRMMLPPYDKGPLKPNKLIELIIKLKG